MFNRFCGSWLIVIMACGALSAQQTGHTRADKDTNEIYVGQPVEEAQAIGRKLKIGLAGPGFEKISRDPDQAHLAGHIDKGVSFAVWYSKSTKKITSITMCYLPTAGAPITKLSYSDQEAQGLRFFADGSYTVHFAPPKKVEAKATP